MLRARWNGIDERRQILSLAEPKADLTLIVPLSHKAREILKMLYPLSGHSEWVFLGPRGKHIVSPGKAKQRIEERAGVKFRINDIRHTVASHLPDLGVRPEIVAAILNHTPPNVPPVTMVYMRYEPLEQMKKALNKWASYLGSLLKEDLDSKLI